MRHLLLILVLTVSGCGSTNWLGLRRSKTTVCDGSTCAEMPLSSAGSINLDPAPITEYPMIEGSAAPLALPEFEIVPPGESVPQPTPDPST